MAVKAIQFLCTRSFSHLTAFVVGDTAVADTSWPTSTPVPAQWNRLVQPVWPTCFRTVHIARRHGRPLERRIRTPSPTPKTTHERTHTRTGLQWNVGDVNAASTRSFLPFLLTSLFHAAPFTVWRPPHEWRHLLDRQLTYYQPDVASGNAAFPNLNTQKGDMEVQCRHFIGLFSSNDVIFVQWMLWIYTAPGHIYSSYLSLSVMDAHDGTETQYPHLIGFFFYNDVIFNQRNLWTHVAPVRADFKMGACDGGGDSLESFDWFISKNDVRFIHRWFKT